MVDLGVPPFMETPSFDEQNQSETPDGMEAWSSSLFEPTTGHFTPHGACLGGTS